MTGNVFFPTGLKGSKKMTLRRVKGGLWMLVSFYFTLNPLVAEESLNEPVEKKKNTHDAVDVEAEVLRLDAESGLVFMSGGEPLAWLRLRSSAEPQEPPSAELLRGAQRFEQPQKPARNEASERQRGARWTFVRRFREHADGSIRLASNEDDVNKLLGEITIWVEAFRVPGGVRLTVAPQRRIFRRAKDDERAGPERKRGSLAVVLELPADAEGKFPGISADGGEARTLDDQPLLLRATRLSFLGKPAQRMETAASAPAAWVLRRVGKHLCVERPVSWPLKEDEPLSSGGEAVQSVSLRSASFVLYVGRKRDTAGVDISPPRLTKEKYAPGEIVEGSFRVYAGGACPYNPDELSTLVEISLPKVPSAVQTIEEGEMEEREIMRVPCFFETPVEDRLGAFGEGRFYFRFMPPWTGLYGLRLTAAASGGTKHSDAVAFRVSAESSQVPAPMRFKVVQGENCFRTERGALAIPFGPFVGDENEQKASFSAAEAAGQWTREMAKILQIAADKGMTAVRVLLPERAFDEPASPTDATPNLRPEWAEAFDRVFFAAVRKQVFLTPVVFSAKTIRELAGEGGFAAAETARKRLLTLAARYGAFPVFGWELTDDAGGFNRVERQVALDLAGRFRALLSARHPVGAGIGFRNLGSFDDFEVRKSFFASFDFLSLDVSGGASASPVPFGADVKINESELTKLRMPLLRMSCGENFGKKQSLIKSVEAMEEGGLWWANVVKNGERESCLERVEFFAHLVRAAVALSVRENKRGLTEKRFSAESKDVKTGVVMRGWMGTTGMAIVLRRAATEAEKREDLRILLPRLAPGTYRAVWLFENGVGRQAEVEIPQDMNSREDEKRNLPCPQFTGEAVLILEPI